MIISRQNIKEYILYVILEEGPKILIEKYIRLKVPILNLIYKIKPFKQLIILTINILMFEKQIKGFINNFSTNKILVIKDKKLSLSTKFLQMFVIIYLVTDLCLNELYKKVETPSGYTSMWAESNNFDVYNKSFSYCDNPDYNYVYSKPDWIYKNISCVDLEYAEMYVKGENEMFFLTHFTENEVNITNKEKYSISKRDFFTKNLEEMVLAFDHFYSTSFEEGGNIGKKQLDTYLRNCHDNDNAYVFKKGETVKLTLKQWLELACVDLEDLNSGTTISLPDEDIADTTYPYFRLTGIDLLVKISYYNIKSVSGYDDETCIIKVSVNEGWSSKGSTINYISYPKINGDYINHFVDRYKYGVKFKFIVSGIMGSFNAYNVVTHFVSGKVLIDLCAIIVVTFASTFFAKYAKKFSTERISKLKAPTDIENIEMEEIGEVEEVEDIQEENTLKLNSSFKTSSI